MNSPLNKTEANSLIEAAVLSLVESVPEFDVDNNRVLMFDEIAFMVGKWIGVKNKPLASAVSISSLAGQVVGSPIIIGGEYCVSKAESRGPVVFNPPTIPLCFGLNPLMKTMIKTINETDHSPQNMFMPSSETVEIAREYGMHVIGVNLSAYFTTESFLMGLHLMAKTYNSSPSSPILAIGDNARIHVTPEVLVEEIKNHFSGNLYGFLERWYYIGHGTSIYLPFSPGLF